MLLLALHPRLQALNPDLAVLMGTAGVCLGLVEFNRPGRILPGSLGLLLLLLSFATLGGRGVRPAGVLLLLASTAVLVLSAWRPVPLWTLALLALGLACGLRLLLRPGAAHEVHTVVAAPCGLLLAGAGGVLARLACRARRAKALD